MPLPKPRGSLFQALDLPGLPHSWSEAKTNDFFLLAPPESCHQQNASLNSRIAQRNRFVERSDAQPLRPFFLERPCTLHRSMPVAIRFHDRANRHIHAYMPLHYSEVVTEIANRDLSPGRTRRRALCDFDGSHFVRL